MPATEVRLSDAPALNGLITQTAAEKIDFALSRAIAFGTGVGQPLGFRNAPALVTQAAESGQAADTLLPANVSKMLSRLPTQSPPRAVWIIHPDVAHQLHVMTLGDQPI